MFSILFRKNRVKGYFYNNRKRLNDEELKTPSLKTRMFVASKVKQPSAFAETGMLRDKLTDGHLDYNSVIKKGTV